MTKTILVFTLLLFPFSSFAQIGLSKIEFKDKLRNRMINTFVFYPTDETLTSTFAENAAFYGFRAVENSSVSKDGLPFYILVHGTSGNWRNTSWLAKELAKNAIVVSANFPDYTTGEATPEFVLKPWNQPKDVSFLIDAVSASPFGKHIDQNRVVVIGNSLGGYTAMALSGATIDLRRYQEFCKTHSDKSCAYFQEAIEKLSTTNIEKAKQSLFDKRIKASIAITPGFTESMSRESLKDSKTPMLIISAENDLNIPAKTHLSNIPENIEQHQIKESSHFSFLQVCKPNAKAILSEDGAGFVCEDSGNKSRPEIHKETIGLIRNFLAKHGL
ncbi:MAG: alpha/beta fold hydrolase [Desulfobacteraceae bacterium]|jgi:predicted dienelactone hydrolase